MKVLDTNIIKGCLSAEGTIALVTVTAAEVRSKGTRNEHVDITFKPGSVIYGDPVDQLVLWSYTSKGDPILEEGSDYVIGAVPLARVAPRLKLLGHVKVPKGKEAECVKAHQQLVQGR